MLFKDFMKKIRKILGKSEESAFTFKPILSDKCFNYDFDSNNHVVEKYSEPKKVSVKKTVTKVPSKKTATVKKPIVKKPASKKIVKITPKKKA